MSQRSNLADNPWFWLMLFGGMGIVAVVAIGPKHAARQARLERMAESRQRAAAAREAGVAASAVETQQSAAMSETMNDATRSVDGPIEPYVDADYLRRPRLEWLLLLTTGLMLAGTVGLLRSRRREMKLAVELPVGKSTR